MPNVILVQNLKTSLYFFHFLIFMNFFIIILLLLTAFVTTGVSSMPCFLLFKLTAFLRTMNTTIRNFKNHSKILRVLCVCVCVFLIQFLWCYFCKALQWETGFSITIEWVQREKTWQPIHARSAYQVIWQCVR